MWAHRRAAARRIAAQEALEAAVEKGAADKAALASVLEGDLAGGFDAPVLPGDGAARSILEGGPAVDADLEAADHREFNDLGEADLEARYKRQRVDIEQLQAAEAMVTGGPDDAPYLASLNLIQGPEGGGNTLPGTEAQWGGPNPETLVALPAAWAQVSGVPQRAALGKLTPPMGRDRFADYPLELAGHDMVSTKNIKLDKAALGAAVDGPTALDAVTGLGEKEASLYGTSLGLNYDKLKARSLDPDSREELASIDYLVEQGRWSDRADMLWFYKLHAPLRPLPTEKRNHYDAAKRRRFMDRAKRTAQRAALSRRLTALEVEKRGGMDPGLAGDARGHVARLDGGRIGAPGPNGFPSMQATQIFAKSDTKAASAKARELLEEADREGVTLHPAHLPSLHDRTAAEVAEAVLKENYLADRSDADRMAAMLVPGGVDPMVDPVASPSLAVPDSVQQEDVMTRGMAIAKAYADDVDAFDRTARAMKEQGITLPSGRQPGDEVHRMGMLEEMNALRTASTDAAMEAKSGGLRRGPIALQHMVRQINSSDQGIALVEPTASGGAGIANEVLSSSVPTGASGGAAPGEEGARGAAGSADLSY